MIVGVIHSTLQMEPHVISFYGVTSGIRFMFLLFPPSILEVKVRIRTAIETITADMRKELDYPVAVRSITNGAHVEQLYGM